MTITVGTGAATPGARADVYLSAADWLAAMPLPAAITGFPAQSAVAQDAFGNWLPGVSRTVQATEYPGDPTPVTVTGTWNPNLAAGQWSGAFSCHSAYNPCYGAYRITYTFPFEITGFAGQLHIALGYYGGQTQGQDNLPFFDIPAPTYLPSDPYYQPYASPRTFDGFYGALFAPTRTITIDWLPGFHSSDDFESFSLTSAIVVRAPEPSSLAVFAAGLALLLARMGSLRRSAGPHTMRIG